MDVDIQHAEDGGHHETDGCQGQAKAAVAGKHGGRGVGEVDVPAQGIAGALTEGQGQDQAADVGNHLVAVFGQQEQNQGNAQPHEGLQHVRAALEGTELHDLGLVGLVGALFRFQGHGSKADGQAMVRNDLHQPVVYHHKTKLLADDIDHQQHGAAQQGGGNQTFAEQGDGAPQNVAHHQKQQQQTQLHHKAPDGIVVCQRKIPVKGIHNR